MYVYRILYNVNCTYCIYNVRIVQESCVECSTWIGSFNESVKPQQDSFTDSRIYNVYIIVYIMAYTSAYVLYHS